MDFSNNIEENIIFSNALMIVKIGQILMEMEKNLRKMFLILVKIILIFINKIVSKEKLHELIILMHSV